MAQCPKLMWGIYFVRDYKRPVDEVLLVSVNSWGGSIDMLAVIRPISSDDLAQDRFAEDLVSVWLNELLG